MSVVTNATLSEPYSIAARAANLATVVVFPTPVGPSKATTPPRFRMSCLTTGIWSETKPNNAFHALGGGVSSGI
ncbi:Uncharacterised protein [Vibrio cholerae]|nr:Uncharacterised protein [Vibrio cholerae]